jgi:hypothetical protein
MSGKEAGMWNLLKNDEECRIPPRPAPKLSALGN